MIDFYPQARIGLFEYARIQRELTEQLGKSVDMVTPQALSKYIRAAVLKEAEVVYER